LSTSIIYDDKSRVIQTQSNNIYGGLDVVTNQYSWNGQLLTNVTKAAQGSNTFIVTTKNDLDDLGRVWSISKAISSTINGVAVSKPKYLFWYPEAFLSFR
jgi:hypothetical protein